MKTFLISEMVYLITPACFSQINILDASTLAAALKENAHSVKREEKINFEVKDIDAAKLSVHQVYTVLDAEGEDVLYFTQYSDEFRKLEDAEIKVFDAAGKTVNKSRTTHLYSQATSDGHKVQYKVIYFRGAAPTYLN